MRTSLGKPSQGWRLRLYTVIFESDTPAGRLFDQVLIALILLSVAIVMLDSVATFNARWGGVFDVLEWVVTALFTLEYLGRLACVRRPLAYATSFFGVIDLLSILPAYFALFAPAAGLLIDVRVLRLLRVFRVFKLGGYVAEFTGLAEALHASRRKILVFLSFVTMVVVVMGTVMYVVEGPRNGFANIPTAMYWAVTTMTTVGFGDITPKTDVGRFISAMMMMLGWGVLAVPTGIVTAEMTARRGASRSLASALRSSTGVSADARHDGDPLPHLPSHPPSCPRCEADGHHAQARFCWRCGTALSAGHAAHAARGTPDTPAPGQARST